MEGEVSGVIFLFFHPIFRSQRWDCLVLVDPHSGHLLEDSLSSEGVQAVDLQLGIPNVFQCFRRLVHLLRKDIGKVVVMTNSP